MTLDPAMVRFARDWGGTLRAIGSGQLRLSNTEGLPSIQRAVQHGLLRDLGRLDDARWHTFAAGPHLNVYLAAAALTRRAA
jgi:hypothetical protein